MASGEVYSGSHPSLVPAVAAAGFPLFSELFYSISK